MLEGQSDDVRKWLEGAGERYGIVPVMLPAASWNDDLTPWPAGPIFKKGKAFGGKAGAYLERLENETIPGIEAGMGIKPEERWFVGVSLAGLFGVWSTAESPLFQRVASVSGSFWYPGFVEWLQGRRLSAKSVYISLGDKESQGRNPHLAGIAEDTAAVVGILKAQGIPATFQQTEGTHFGPLIPRLELALSGLASHYKE